MADGAVKLKVETTPERFDDLEEERLLQYQLLNGKRGTRRLSVRDEELEQTKRIALLTASAQIQAEFEEANLAITETEARQMLQLRAKTVSEVPFPVLFMLFTSIKDFIDLIGFTGFGLIITIPLGVLYACALALKFLMKMHEDWYSIPGIRRNWKSYVIKRLIFMIPAETIPFFQGFPFASLFLLFSHARENKLIRQYNKSMEGIRRTR